MAFQSIGDLAGLHQNRRLNFELKTTLQTLSQELASGKKSDISTSVSGDFGTITALEKSLRTAVAYSTATAETTLLTASMQLALEQIQENSSELATIILAAGTSGDALTMQTTAADAKSKFGAVISALNLRVADRYAFSGVATDSAPMANETEILDAIQLAISTETTAQGVINILDSWFDSSGGGFETIAFTGSSTSLGTVKLSEEESVDLTTTAADDALRKVLKGLAMASMVAEGNFIGTQDEQAKLAVFAGELLHSSQYDLTTLRANLGSVEAHISNITASNEARTSSLEIAMTELTAVDPYQVAIQLEAVQVQLEVFYTITARLSRLSLAEYLR